MMVGGVAVAVELHSLPCLSVVDALPPTTSVTVLCNSLKKKHSHFLRRETMQLSTSFVEWHHNHSNSVNANFKRHRRHKERTRRLTIFNNLGGQYEETFYDVKKQIVKYFTYKAVRTVLQQLYEMNPPQYRWFYNFVATNDPADGKRFIRTLVKEQHELAERVMVTRLHLYGKWIKKCNHAEIYQEISDQNLELMRERLIETVIWPSDDTNTEKIG